MTDRVDKFVRMAGAMDRALGEMRTLYALLKRGVERQDGQLVFHPTEAQAVCDKVGDVANILKTGLKAREPHVR